MSKKALTVSIVIPVYNQEDHLKACLQTIAKQTVKPDEVIVVNNNSTDGSVAVAKSFPFVRLLHEKEQGVRAARNKGFNSARSTIIGRLDADSRLPRDWVKRVKQFYQNPKNFDRALAGNCEFYNVRCPHLNQWIVGQFVFRMNRFTVGHYLLWGSNMAIPKYIWDDVKSHLCARDDIHEDLDLALHIHERGFDIVYQATLIVGAYMGRVFDDHQKLWPYLLMWPHTLRVHRVGRWRLSYLGTSTLYVGQVVPRAAEAIARLFGRPALNSPDLMYSPRTDF